MLKKIMKIINSESKSYSGIIGMVSLVISIISIIGKALYKLFHHRNSERHTPYNTDNDIDNVILEKHKHNDRQKLIDKRKDISIRYTIKRIRQSWSDIDNILAPVSFLHSKLFDIYPPENTPSNFYKYFIKNDNMSNGRKYVRITHRCYDKLLLEMSSKEYVLHNNQDIKALLKKCVGDLSFLWHILQGQFDDNSGLIYEVKYSKNGEIQSASKLLYKYAKLLETHKRELDNKFSNLINTLNVK